MTGYVDEINRCWRGGLPRPELRKIFGVWSEELDYLFDDESIAIAPVEGNALGLTVHGKGRDVVEHLHLEGAEALATYTSDFIAGGPAVTHRRCGAGHVYYVGAMVDDDLLHDLYSALAVRHGLKRPLEELPEGVALRFRSAAEGEVAFLFNYLRNPVTVDLGSLRLKDRASGEILEGSTTLPPYASVIANLL